MVISNLHTWMTFPCTCNLLILMFSSDTPPSLKTPTFFQFSSGVSLKVVGKYPCSLHISKFSWIVCILYISLAAAQRANIDFFSLRSKSADSSPTWGRNKEKKKELVLKLFQRPLQCPKHVPPMWGTWSRTPETCQPCSKLPPRASSRRLPRLSGLPPGVGKPHWQHQQVYTSYPAPMYRNLQDLPRTWAGTIPFSYRTFYFRRKTE